MPKVFWVGIAFAVLTAAHVGMRFLSEPLTNRDFDPAQLGDRLRGQVLSLAGGDLPRPDCNVLFVCRLDCGACRATAQRDSATKSLTWLLPDSAAADAWATRYGFSHSQVFYLLDPKDEASPFPHVLGFNATPTRILLGPENRLLDFVVTRKQFSDHELALYCDDG